MIFINNVTISIILRLNDGDIVVMNEICIRRFYCAKTMKKNLIKFLTTRMSGKMMCYYPKNRQKVL